MLKRFCQKINRAVLILAFLAGWAALSGCQSQNAAPVPARNSGGPAAPGSASNADERAAESSAVASALTAPKTSSTSTTPATPGAPSSPDNEQGLVLHEGDTVSIKFPGAHSLDSTQTIRRDGKITLEMVGEIKAAGLTAPALEQQLLKAYGDQLVDKEVSVVVQTSVFEVYVTGAVLKPGKVVSDHVLTPLEALIESGIDHEKANLKKVVVLREHDDGKTERFTLNVDNLMKGKATKPFVLQSMDKIYVPEKFNWF